MHLGELDAVERQLWDSFAQGTAVDVRDGTSSVECAVRADVIAALLLGAAQLPPRGTAQHCV